jgi:photosystem II reaction center protein PsbP
LNHLILFAFSIFGLILVFAIDTYAQTLTNSYANQKCNISINYPSNWKFEETTFDDPATVINYIVELKPDNDEGFRNVVGIELDDISTLPDKSFEGIKDYEEEVLSTVGDLDKIITSDTVQVGGYPAQKIVYTEGLEGTPDDERFKKMAVVIVAFDREYKINYDASNAVYYDKHISDFEAMLQTFKITQPTFEGIVC